MTGVTLPCKRVILAHKTGLDMKKRQSGWVAALLIALGAIQAQAQTLTTAPYLQDAEPNAIRIMWETSAASESRVEWGETPALGQAALGASQTGQGNSRIHDVPLTGLTPATRYYYRVVVGSLVSPTYDFITPPLPEAEASFSLVAMSDMQRDGANPDVFRQICEEGVISYAAGRFGPDLPDNLAFAIIPGDLVDNGSSYAQWADYFFAPSAKLFRHVPVYPVAGNHENDSPNYFKYFHLPENGSQGYIEHWWYKDYSNVRIIGLESNAAYRVQAQLDWLQGVLDDACANEHIDFVFAQLHHPYHSELWLAGNTDYTGEVITLMENFSTLCGKPSAHFFGHTHGYSRGESLYHNHLMVNVASAGGNIDFWGEYAQNDYPEYSVSHDDYGFVWLDVQAGDDPQFLLSRLSRGAPGMPLDNVLRDSVRIRFHNPSPDQPEGLFPYEGSALRPECILFKAGPFHDGDGDLQGATHWQVASDSLFETLVYDKLRSHQNWYNNTDTQVGDDLSDERITTLAPERRYWWRVRYRDRSLAWSSWSEALSFETLASSLTANLLENPGAEAGLAGWTEVAGSFESILSGECAGNPARSGERLFAVGGVCEEFPYAEGYQQVDLTPYAAAVAEGSAAVRFGGYLSDYNGSDRPEFRLDFIDSQGAVIGSTPTRGIQTPVWTLFDESAMIPPTAAQLRLVLMGTRNAGTDNDSYFDDMFVQLDLDPGDCEEMAPVFAPEARPAEAGLIKVYPNPWRGEATLTLEVTDWDGQPYEAQLYDAAGRLLRNLKASGAQLQLSGSGLPAGVYLLKATRPGRSYGHVRVTKAP